MNKLKAWQYKWELSDEVMNELSDILGLSISVDDSGPAIKYPIKSEAAIQADCRVRGSRQGGRLWRNNSGATTDNHGNFIRYGLANESKAMNKLIKSSDLIGIKPVLITQNMVGSIIGQFWAIEAKKGDWFYTGSDREKAQLKFIELVQSLGGTAKFVNDACQLGDIK